MEEMRENNGGLHRLYIGEYKATKYMEWKWRLRMASSREENSHQRFLVFVVRCALIFDLCAELRERLEIVLRYG